MSDPYEIDTVLLNPDPAATLLRSGPSSPVGPGTRLLNDRFELQGPLGQGGMGIVYRALDLEAERLQDPRPHLALKVLAESIQSMPQARLGMQRELSRARRLTHPNIIRMYEFYEDREICFITMELLEGSPWDQVMKSHPRGMPLAQARPLIEQLCAALSYAHGQAVVHSDLKPQNIFLTREQQVKVLDFGIAAPMRRPAGDGPVTDTLYNPRQMLAMTRRYACPEMWQGVDADPRDDVFSAAAILHELLSGSHPFGGMTAAEAFHSGLTPEPISQLNAAQNHALKQALALSRRERTASIDALLTGLLTPAPRSPWYRDTRLLAGGGAATGLAAVAALMLLPHQEQQAPRAPRASAAAPARTGTGTAAGTGTKTEADRVSDTAARSLVQLLGIAADLPPAASHPRTEVRAVVARAARRVPLGSTAGQLSAALALCHEAGGRCDPATYADETPREPLLPPFRIDPTAVTVEAFRGFVTATGHQTEAERAGIAYAFLGGQLHRVPGGTWRNAAGTGTPSEASAVVGVSFADARAYCRWRGARLPTEDEWEYAARGPRAHVFPWGEEPGPARERLSQRPAAADGPREGIDGSLRGMSGNVWEWVDTPGAQGPDHRMLKGGSWLETNPANRRAAVRRSELASRADSDSGFRCAQPVEEWPDAAFWMARLR